MDQFSIASLLVKNSEPLGWSQPLCFVGEPIEVSETTATKISPHTPNGIFRVHGDARTPFRRTPARIGSHYWGRLERHLQPRSECPYYTANITKFKRENLQSFEV